LNHDPFDRIEAQLVAAAIVELRRARRGMVAISTAFSSVRPFLRYADPGSPEAVIAEPGSYPRGATLSLS